MKIFYSAYWLNKKYIATISYVLMIVLVNVGFAYTPILHVLGEPVSLMDPVAGIIYLVRDFAQRELSHKDPKTQSQASIKLLIDVFAEIYFGNF